MKPPQAVCVVYLTGFGKELFHLTEKAWIVKLKEADSSFEHSVVLIYTLLLVSNPGSDLAFQR
jgi:hypothetical protein